MSKPALALLGGLGLVATLASCAAETGLPNMQLLGQAAELSPSIFAVLNSATLTTLEDSAAFAAEAREWLHPGLRQEELLNHFQQLFSRQGQQSFTGSVGKFSIVFDSAAFTSVEATVEDIRTADGLFMRSIIVTLISEDPNDSSTLLDASLHIYGPHDGSGIDAPDVNWAVRAWPGATDGTLQPGAEVVLSMGSFTLD